MNIETAVIMLSLPAETIDRLHRLNAARNGNLHNTAAAALEEGLTAIEVRRIAARR